MKRVSATKISVIVCTHNRSDYLKEALNSLTSQSLCKDDYEVIVIDNASRDKTRQVVNQFVGVSDNVRYYYERTVGLSAARNRGIKEARSDFVVFVDDDTVASRDLLSDYLSSYRSVEPMPHSIGGRIILDWKVPKPLWYPGTRAFERSLAGLDYGDEARFLNFAKYEYPFGANMSFIREVLLEIGGADTNIDRLGTKLLSNGDLKIFDTLYHMGKRVYYLPNACVWHAVTAERATKRFFKRRFFWQGISNAVWLPNEWNAIPKTIPQNVRRLGKASIELLRAYLRDRSNEPEILSRVCEVLFPAGFLMHKVLGQITDV